MKKNMAGIMADTKGIKKLNEPAEICERIKKLGRKCEGNAIIFEITQ